MHLAFKRCKALLVHVGIIHNSLFTYLRSILYTNRLSKETGQPKTMGENSSLLCLVGNLRLEVVCYPDFFCFSYRSHCFLSFAVVRQQLPSYANTHAVIVSKVKSPRTVDRNLFPFQISESIANP